MLYFSTVKPVVGPSLTDLDVIYTAFRKDDTETIMHLAYKLGVNCRVGLFNETLLHLAARNYKRSIVKQLLINFDNINVDARDVFGNTPLMSTVYCHFNRHRDQEATEIVQMLLNFGCNVDIRDNFGANVIQMAAKHGWYQIVRILMQHRYAKTYTFEDVCLAIYGAVDHQHSLVGNLLIDCVALELHEKMLDIIYGKRKRQ